MISDCTVFNTKKTILVFNKNIFWGPILLLTEAFPSACILHCHLSHIHIFPKRGFFFVGRFKDLALDLIAREKMKQIRFSMRGWQLWLIEKGNQPNKVFFRGKTNPHTDGNICFQYYIIILHLFLESFVHPSQMMWWYVTILIRVLGVL